jgi:glycosyltransferase involved in cell wall biosynthesis
MPTDLQTDLPTRETGAVPMKVLVWQWGQRGAGPRFAAEAAGALQAAGFDVTLSLSSNTEANDTLVTLCRRRLPFQGREAGRSGARVLVGLPRQLWGLFGAIRRQRPAMALCAMAGYWDVPFALLLKLCGVKVLTVVHEVEAHPGDINGGFYRLQRVMIRLSDAIVTLSDHVARQVEAVWPLKTVVRAFHPPFGFDDLDLAPPVPLAASEGPLRLLIVGRMWSYKGTAMALDAFERLPEGRARLRVVGQGNELPSERHAPDRGIVVENRWLSEAELVGEIDAAEIVLFPYVEASQSGLIPLCLARGRPVVATAVGGLVEQLAPAAAGAVASDVGADAVAAAIGHFLANRDALPRISAAAIQANDPPAGWRAFARNLADAFRSRPLAARTRSHAEP